jgi:hypothetical protein
MSNSLIININGGLGNQLFMLFAGISNAIDNNKDFLIYCEKNERKFYFDDFFNFLQSKVINNQIKYSYHIIKNSHIENHFHYVPIPNNTDFIKGYFQSYKYFQHNYKTIYNLFHFDSHLNNIKYQLDFPYISMHLRLGDYINLTDYHNVLQVNYYINALNHLKNKLGNNLYNYKILIFGEKTNDDIISTYLRQLNKDNKLNFIKIYDLNTNNQFQDYDEMILMSKASHNIIGNSTFSWWGAYLSNNPHKIIIYPHKSKWFGKNFKHYDLNDLFPPNWTEIDY